MVLMKQLKGGCGVGEGDVLGVGCAVGDGEGAAPGEGEGDADRAYAPHEMLRMAPTPSAT